MRQLSDRTLLGVRARPALKLGMAMSGFAALLLLACEPQRIVAKSNLPSPALDPALMQRLKDQRFTGVVISLETTAEGTVYSTPSRAASIGAASQSSNGSRSTLSPPSTPAYDISAGSLMFIVQPAGGKSVPGGNPQFGFRLFWDCIIGGVNYGRIQNVSVSGVNNIPLDGTGGHTGAHAGQKPGGNNNPSHGVTDGAGFFTTTYTATEVSGDEQMDVNWSTSDQASACVGFGGTDTYFHATRWQGLARMTGTADLVFAPIQSQHSSVYYATPTVASMAQKAGAAYRSATHGANPLIVNAASLVYGGLEDINNNWSPPHATHRIGTDVDFDGLAGPAGDTPRVWALVKKAAINGGGFKVCDIHNKNHVHCYGYVY
jgi:hypothetical protein